MPHGRKPGLSAVRCWRAPQLHTFGVHRHAQQGHVVLPADHRTDPAQRGIEHWECGAITESPDVALGCGGHELAVLAEQAIGREEQRRAVQRAAIPFDHTDNHVLVILGSYLDQPLDRRAGHIHR